MQDDGDALRLAVKLRLRVRDGEAQDGHDIYAAEDGDDPYAATRRAIVRAAAEIGRGMGGSNVAIEPRRRRRLE